jgi:hypothetical protein
VRGPVWACPLTASYSAAAILCDKKLEHNWSFKVILLDKSSVETKLDERLLELTLFYFLYFFPLLTVYTMSSSDEKKKKKKSDQKLQLLH